MEWKSFHHPDISLPVIRRKAGEELLSLLEETSGLLLTGGRQILYKGCYPNTHAFDAALFRLQKKGLIAKTKTDGSLPTIKLTPAAKSTLAPGFTPEQFWNKKWSGVWYLLMFDVPEKDRAYRDTLRAFLKQMKFGCLQKSVWVSPWDVRSEYDDLNKTACVDSVAFLFEAKTVLGFGHQSVVRESWDFEKINRIQQLYIQFATENLTILGNESPSESEIIKLVRMDNLAYTQAMSIDPLLPRALHPTDYEGPQVTGLHRKLLKKAAAIL